MTRRARTIAAAATALAGLIALSGCAQVVIERDSGPRETVTREITEVTAVDIRTSGTMRVVAGDTPTLTITAGERVLEEITAVVQGGTLTIELPGTWLNPGPIDYELVTPALASVTVRGSADVSGDLAPAGGEVEIHVAGSGDVDLSGATADEVEIEIEGSGNVTLDGLAARSVEAEIEGSGDVGLAGTADELTVTIAGSGVFDGEDLATQEARVTVRGSGDAYVTVERSLDVRIDGSGDVVYHGDPQVRQDVNGSGDVVRG
jgi:hypothetical protein